MEISTDREKVNKALAMLLETRSIKKELLEEFTKLHRTHQQMEGGILLDLIFNIGKLYGGPERSRYFDGRNEHLGKICFEINTFMENHRNDMWYKLPVI